ncbi:GNAT family N-acetyltransferase [Blastopirellula sp. JC732]|uniref:GNAT family N-acetyltransferase n=1 Tax=Blastopirellula sediminis TaxID=2894196 RepID=A0A9X1SFP7_9BACT|nr:GNAT family N-acetyltransferase [Blastopirellula sediminis]MCC9627972.1 GNAT family N-acetyltransferase [Blastopirellula sediminis]
MTTIVTFAEQPSADDWICLHGEIFLARRDRWSVSRFERELTTRSWFSPQRMWWSIDLTSQQPNGVVTLEIARDIGRIHWLMVAPNARRKQVATALLTTLEQSAWDHGVRQLSAETLLTWGPAVAFYRSHGYQ